MKKQKVLLFGIDGATWRIIEPLIEKGKLPNLESLINSGVKTTLKSIEPPVSPMVWTSIASGKLPEKHGVRDFIVTSKSVKCKRIWNILGDEDWRVGLMDYLVTSPPEKVDGFCVPSHFAHTPETYPPDLGWINELLFETKKEEKLSHREMGRYLKNLLKFGVSLKTILRSGIFKLKNRTIPMSFYDYFYPIREIKLRMRTDIYISLIERFQPHFMAYMTNLVDASSHNYWKFHEPEKFSNEKINSNKLEKYGKIIERAYIESDKALGKVMKNIDEDAIVVVVSDHGFKADISENAQVSLTMRPSKLADILDLKDDFRYFNIGSKTIFKSIEDNVDKERKLKNELLKFSFLKNGDNLFTIRSNDNYNLIVTLNNRKELAAPASIEVGGPNGNKYKLTEFVRTSGKSISGTHDKDGILILNGPQFKVGEGIDSQSVIDVTPTILYALGFPVAKDFDGKIIKRAFIDDFREGRPVERINSYDKGWEYKSDESDINENLEKRLEDLGYL